MATFPVPNTVEVQLRGKHGTDDRISTVHYRHGGANDPIPVTNLTSLGTSFLGAVLPYLRPCVGLGVTWLSVSVQDIGRHGGNKVTLPLLANNTSTRPGGLAPGNVNIALAKDTDAHAKGETGRFWLMDIINSDVVDAVISAGLQALITVLMAGLTQHVSDGATNYAPVVASKKHGTFHTILGMTTDSTTDELITRLKGHKKHRKRRAVPA